MMHATRNPPPPDELVRSSRGRDRRRNVIEHPVVLVVVQNEGRLRPHFRVRGDSVHLAGDERCAVGREDNDVFDVAERTPPVRLKGKSASDVWRQGTPAANSAITDCNTRRRVKHDT